MSYQSEVAADSPFVYYPDASAAPWADDIGSNDITITGATANQTGPLDASQDTKAFSFDGTDDTGAVSLNLSDTSTITVEFWLWWDTFANNDDLAMEFTADAGSNPGGFYIDPNGSPASAFDVVTTGNVGANGKQYPRPSGAAWHHYAIVLDYTQAASDEITAYLDGALWTPSGTPFSSNNSGAFANSQLNVMCRNGASLFGAGDMAHLAIYKSAVSAVRVQAHFDAADDVVAAPTVPNVQVVRSALRF